MLILSLTVYRLQRPSKSDGVAFVVFTTIPIVTESP